MHERCRHFLRRKESWRRENGGITYACRYCRYKWARARLAVAAARRKGRY